MCGLAEPAECAVPVLLQRFDRFMYRASIPCLFKDGESPGISEFSDLVPGATYATCLGIIPSRTSIMEEHQQYLDRLREQVLRAPS
jgi:hypothetical protein